MKLHELQEERAGIVAEMRDLDTLAEVENRDLTADEGKAFKGMKAKLVAIEEKISRKEDLAAAERSAPAILHGAMGDGRFEERARKFSIVKAIVASLPRDMGGGNVDAAFEREISLEVQRRSGGRRFQGIAVPDQALLPLFERRTVLAGSTGEPLIPEVHRGDLFIEPLRPNLVTQALGATVLSGLVGIVDIPRQTASSQAQWVAEDAALTETDPGFDDVTLSPKTVGSTTSYSRRTLISALPPIEAVVRNDLANKLAAAIDIAAMTGTGAANTPVGIVSAPGTHNIAVAAPTWDDILLFPATVANANAAVGSLGWALSPFAAKILRSTPKITNGSAGFLMDLPGQLAGYPAATTSALPGAPGAATPPPDPVAGTMIFGDWSSLLVGYWSGVDILVNPYETTAYARGRILIRAMQDVDVQVRHGESFAFTTDLVV